MAESERPRLPARERSVSVDVAGGPPPERRLQRPLSELAGDHVFFNHGLLFTRGDLAQDMDPVRSFCERESVPAPERPMLAESPRALFVGVGIVPEDRWLDRALFVVGRRWWPGIDAAIRGASGVDWSRRVFWSAAALDVRIPDPLWPAGAPTAPPDIEVRLFAPSGSARRWGVRHFGDAAGAQPCVVISGPPDPDVVALAEAVFSASANPFRAIEPTRFPDDTPRLQLPDDL